MISLLNPAHPILTQAGKPNIQRRYWPFAMRWAVLTATVTLTLLTAARGQTERALYSFEGLPDGATPYAGLLRDAAGNLYGTTYYGGTYNKGTVFKLDSTGRETVLYTFTGGLDGAYPMAALIEDSAGNLYGTTSLGGIYGVGAIFRLNATGNETVLYNFTGGADGGYPEAGLIEDGAGNFYSTTSGGGAYGAGTVFKLDASGIDTVLYSFKGGVDGLYPNAVVQDPAGDLFGTTFNGGAYGAGTIFEVDVAGNKTTLYTFSGGADSGWPVAGLIRDATGNLYGTTRGFYGQITVEGSAFELDVTGKETVLHTFSGGSDGEEPYSSLVRDAAGNLYGTTYAGGTYGQGTVFKLDAAGRETVLYSFAGRADGQGPYSGLTPDAAGNFYGTTVSGGTVGDGVVFEIAPLSLLFPVKQHPQCGGTCSPQNAPINTVFDHDTAVAYECQTGVGGYGSMMAFTGEPATVKYSGFKTGAGQCANKLFGYTNPNISIFLEGYNYTGNSAMYYDGHPGYDYNFGYGTPLRPALNGCVTYFQPAAGLPSGRAGAERGHVLAIIPQPTEPPGGCKDAGNPSGYTVAYMHLASFYDDTSQQVLACKSSSPRVCNAGKEVVPCPTCAQQDEWVSTDRTNPIGYTGNFFGSRTKGWGAVGPHLHFEVDQLIGNKPPQGIDPYGWCGPGPDPYTAFTGLVNTTLWSGFVLTCPAHEQ